MPANSILHAFTLSPALPRLGGGSTLVAVLQDVMIYEKRFSIPLSKCHSRLVPVFFDRFRLWPGQHVLWTAAAAYMLVALVALVVLAAGQLRVKRGRSSYPDQLSMR